MNFRAGTRPRRGVNLTPMVDVVFLLLFFFMLASRFGIDQAMPLSLAGGGADWSGPPRLVEVGPGGDLRLNGAPVAEEALPGALDGLMDDRAEPVVIAPRDGATVGDLTAVLDGLRREGFRHFGVAE